MKDHALIAFVSPQNPIAYTEIKLLNIWAGLQPSLQVADPIARQAARTGISPKMGRQGGGGLRKFVL